MNERTNEQNERMNGCVNEWNVYSCHFHFHFHSQDWNKSYNWCIQLVKRNDDNYITLNETNWV